MGPARVGTCCLGYFRIWFTVSLTSYVMTVAEIKMKQYERFSASVPDTAVRHRIRMDDYLLVTEEELTELAKGQY